MIAESTAASAPTEPLLKVRGIEKHFGAVQALYAVDLDLPAGFVTALCGDNGAGKSVLTKCISGVYQPDHGQIFWEGTPVHVRSTRDASRLGIETVYQDLALCDNLDVVQNMYLGREEHDLLWRLKEPLMEQRTAETLRSLSVTTIRSIRQPVASLSGGQRQSGAVAKAVMWNSKLVILDEPTAALGVVQTKNVLESIKRTHRLAVAHEAVTAFGVGAEGFGGEVHVHGAGQRIADQARGRGIDDREFRGIGAELAREPVEHHPVGGALGRGDFLALGDS